MPAALTELPAQQNMTGLVDASHCGEIRGVRVVLQMKEPRIAPRLLKDK